MKDKYGNSLNFSQIIVKILLRIVNILLEFEIFILHIIGNIPSHHVRRFFYRLAGIQIGKGTSLHMGIRFYDPRNIQIGDDTVIGEGTVLDGRDVLIIGNHVAIASEVMIYNAEHDIDSEGFDPINQPVTIKDYVFIGPRAIILPGVMVGEGAVIAAGAVVTKNVASHMVVGGVPAKVIKERKNKKGAYTLGRARWFR